MRNQIVYLLVITILSCVPTSAELDWIRVTTEYKPPRIDDHNMVYCIQDQVCLSYGWYNRDSAPLYLYDGDNWYQVTPSGDWPIPRSNFGMAYDASRNVVVVFGGFQGGFDYLGDTWEWDGSQWEEKFPEHSPEDRTGIRLTYVSFLEEVVGFGGYTENMEVTNEFWLWDGTDWTLETSSGPSPRTVTAITCDTANNQLILFGGTEDGGTPLGDTWSWNGVDWQEIETITDPGGRYNHRLTYDANRQVSLLYGGVVVSDDYTTSNWEFNGYDWNEIETDHRPSARSMSAACYDSNRQRIVLYGGYTWSGSNNETWEYYDVPTPTITPSPTVTPSPSPTPPPTITPTSTATPQDGIILSLDLPDNPVHTGDAFFLDISINSNYSSDLSSIPMFCILEVAGSFWYYPTWEMTPSWETITIHPGNQIVPILPEFLWPADCGSGTARFWAAMTDMEITRIFGNVDVRDVVWDPSLLIENNNHLYSFSPNLGERKRRYLY